jgi:hypothetical protein
VPQRFCGYSARHTAASILPSDSQIPAQGSIYLQLVVGEVPEAAPANDVVVFAKNCVLGPQKQQGCDSAKIVEIPQAT